MAIPDPAFSYRSFSRYVEVFDVSTGWLVVWGRYEDQVETRIILGQRTYTDLFGVRNRVQAAVEDLTRDRELVFEATTLFDRSTIHQFDRRTPAST